MPFPTPGDLPNPGIKPESLVSPALAGGFFTTAPPGKPKDGEGRAQLRSLWTSKCSYQLGLCVWPLALLGKIELRGRDGGGMNVKSEAMGLVSQELIQKNDEHASIRGRVNKGNLSM